MKKLMISLAIGAAVLGATVAPASAGPVTADFDTPLYVIKGNKDSIWDTLKKAGAINSLTTGTDDAGWAVGVDDLVLLAGMSNMLDVCGNGEAQYTFFAPNGPTLSAVFAAMASSLADLAASPDVVKGILNDHLVNGSFAPAQLGNSSTKALTARSGYVIRVQHLYFLYESVLSTPAPGEDEILNDWFVDGNQVIYGTDACNGWLYVIAGQIDSTPLVTSEGMNALDTPQDGTPGGTNSLPNTL